VERADAVITDSEFSRREIVELLGVPEDRVFAIHLGLPDHRFTPPAATRSQVLLRLGLDRPYLLTVGTLEPRKNIPFLVEVFEQLEHFDGDLVIAGMRGWKYAPILERIRQSPRADRIRYLEYVTDAELAALYSGAELFVCTSVYEGFGFTPLEAMVAGTPVVSAPSGSLAEVLGLSAELVPGWDADLWAGRIRQLLDDESRRQALAVSGRAHVQRFTWADTARRTWDVYRKVGR